MKTHAMLNDLFVYQKIFSAYGRIKGADVHLYDILYKNSFSGGRKASNFR